MAIAMLDKPEPDISITQANRRSFLKERVEREMSEYDLKERATVSSVSELKSASGMTTSAGINLALSEILISKEEYVRWKKTPKTGVRTEDMLFAEFKQIIRQEIIDFWREKIDQLSKSPQLQRRLSISTRHLNTLISRLPKAIREHRRMIMVLSKKGYQIRFRSIILLMIRELAAYKKDHSFILTRNSQILEMYGIYWVGLYKYRNRVIPRSAQLERTRVLLSQYKYIKHTKAA